MFFISGIGREEDIRLTMLGILGEHLCQTPESARQRREAQPQEMERGFGT